MTTAESIVQEYLENGYSLEALRLLALNRADDLGKELLEIIDKMSVEKTPAAAEDSGPCDAIASAVVETDENVLVFVADDEEDVSGECAHHESGTAPVDSMAEESVADVLIEGGDGAEIVAPELSVPRSDEFRAKVAGLIAQEAEKGQSGILTRLWSRVSAKAAPAMARHEALYVDGGKKTAAAATAADNISEAKAADRESTIAEVETENVVFASDRESSVAMAEASEIVFDAVAEPEPVAEQAEQVEDVVASSEETAPAPAPEQELTDDYLPGSVSGIYAEDAQDAAVPLTREDAMRALLDAQGVIAAETPAENRTAEKKRKRNRKRKEKRADASAQGDSLPEIVLARSDGTETLRTEDEHQERAQRREPESPNAVIHFPAPLGEQAESAEADEPVDERMSEPMSLLTPADLFSFDEEAAAPSAEDDEFADVSGDHLMIISGGGIAPEEYAHLLPADSLDAVPPEEAVEEPVDEEAGNVILFNEKFPVFAGVRGDEINVYEDDAEDVLSDGEDAAAFAGAYLRMLPNEPVDEAPEADEGLLSERVLHLIDSGLYNEIGDEIDEEIQDAIEEAASAGDEPAAYPAVLHLLAPGDGDASEAVAEPAAEPEPRFRGIDESEKDLVRRALFGFVVDVDDAVVLEDAPGTHAIVREEPEPAPVDELEREAMVRAEMEAEYQERLDEFAGRILQAQAAAAAEAAQVRQKQAELDARGAVIEEMRKRIDAEVMQADAVAGKLAEANGRLDDKDREIRSRDKDLEFYTGIKEEHERLYGEFEDLRRGYNEIVSDVLPKLQGERDDLALTVERQCASEEKLRTSLGSVRRRMAVGYSLAGAACLAMCAFPVANWLKSGRVDREMATERQKLAELHETLQREVQNNIVARNTIVELENKMGVARAQLVDMQKKNQELAKLSRQRQPQNQDVAVFKPQPPAAGGNPTRASEMALQASAPSGQRLHVNQVRDPSGSIEELAMQNRQLNRASEDRDQMVRSPDPLRPIALSAVAASEPPPVANNSLRPLPPPPAAVNPTPKPAAGKTAPAARTGEVAVVKVKKGEGVAQVVYRALGSWDPEVIAWVVKENKLTMDKRGNPRIHPDQELRIPTGNQVARSASR